MMFNSLEFAIFLPLVFLLYWMVFRHSLNVQNFLLVVVSYVFYGWWDWRFLFLIFLSSVVDYFVGISLNKTENASKRKLFLMISVVFNLGLLGFFKYYNFFIDSFIELLASFGYHTTNTWSLQIILPVGISFYTFQTMSYSLDVYRRQLEPTKNFIAFLAFVSFFPQLVAGPIERATNLLPQFYKTREFNYLKSVDGLRQILWGLFKKVVVADNAAYFVNIIFNDYENLNGATLFFGAFLFAFQIYGDFSGYSDIAIGTARLFGFDLMQNFAFPYFSRDIAEFWRRWHISLSTWFRDYLYIPLGGSKGGIKMKIRNTMIIFLVSGFWHGANWTFIVWGFLNALYFLPIILANKNRINTNIVAENRMLPNFKELFQIVVTFFITLIAWVFFRANTIKDALIYLRRMFTENPFSPPNYFLKKVLFFIAVLIVAEWFQRKKQHALEFSTNTKWPAFARWGLYIAIILAIFLFSGEQQAFIYFQF